MLPMAHAQKQLKKSAQSVATHPAAFEQWLCTHWLHIELLDIPGCIVACVPAGHDGPLNGKTLPFPPLLLLPLLHANNTAAVPTAAHAIAETIFIADPPVSLDDDLGRSILHVFDLGSSALAPWGNPLPLLPRALP
jgi:hypothetical protein